VIGKPSRLALAYVLLVDPSKINSWWAVDYLIESLPSSLLARQMSSLVRLYVVTSGVRHSKPAGKFLVFNIVQLYTLRTGHTTRSARRLCNTRAHVVKMGYNGRDYFESQTTIQPIETTCQQPSARNQSTINFDLVRTSPAQHKLEFNNTPTNYRLATGKTC
jgi:hypothetical protein